jgi:hypothetical protein
MGARWIRCALAILATGALVVFPAGASSAASEVALDAASGGIGIRLVDVPVAEQNDPRALLYIVDHLMPGTVIQRRIEIANMSASSTHIALYAAAAAITDGAFLGAAGHTPNELSSWTSLDATEYLVAPHQREIATVTIAVPVDAAPGERYAVVWAETRSAPPGGGVTQVNRVGIRLYVDVGPGGAPAADFTIESLTAMRSPRGQPVVVATVRNTGGRALDMAGTLQLSAGPAGLSAGPFPAELGVTLGIGDTEPVTIALDDRLPNGPWDARIVLHSGLLERTARAAITFPDAGLAPPVDTTSHPPGGLYAGVAVLTVLLAGVAAFLAGSKRHPRRSAPSVMR